MAVVGVLVWIVSAVLAYFVAEVATLRSSRRAWDRTAREFSLVCSILLGPVFLLIAVELLLFSLIGEGLVDNETRCYRDS